MYYQTLRLQQYRSYDDYLVELSPGVNIVVGPNASGKTNLLESIQVLSHGSSFRANDNDLVQFDASWARLDGTTDQGIQRSVRWKRKTGLLEKNIYIDEKLIKRMTHNHHAPATLFEPEHLRMVHGSPDMRRDYLDSILTQSSLGYKDILRKYRRALSQRNRLLKSDRSITADELFVWDVNLSEYGAKIVAHRTALIGQLNERASEIYSALSDTTSQIELVPRLTIEAVDYASTALKALQDRFSKDRLRGFTSIGPHRDDFIFMLDGHDASVSASRGETRTLILMCKLVELFILEQIRGERPILLLDDVFSELDASRRRALTEYLSEYQTIITTTDADAILKHFVGEYAVIPTSTN